jgi:hypothetical protein
MTKQGGSSHQRAVEKAKNPGKIADASAAIIPLQSKTIGRSTLESYAVIAVTIVSLVLKLTWWIKCGLLLMVAVMLVDMLFHLPWIAGLNNLKKGSLSMLGILFLAALAWRPLRGQYKDETAPTSEIRVIKQELGPFEAHKPAYLNMTIFNDSEHTINARWSYLVGYKTVRGARLISEERAEEDRDWAKLTDRLSENTGDIITFSPKVETVVTAIFREVGGRKNEGDPDLTEEQATQLRAGDGHTFLFFMSVFSYADSSGVHFLENCSWTPGKAIYRCNGRNGPETAVPNHWWIIW